MRLVRALASTRSFMFATLLAGTVAHAQGHRLPNDEVLRFPAGRDTVSVPFQNWGEHIVIPVSVNGRPPLQMVFDTGMPSPGVLLYAGALVDSLRLQFGDMQVRIGGAGGGGAREARLASGVTLGVGGLEGGGSIAVVMPPTPQMASLHDGIIGASLFQHLVVSLDHDRTVMTLTRRAAFTPPRGASEVKLSLEGRHAYVPVGLVGPNGGSTPLELILDLGATHTLSLSRRTHDAIVLPQGARATRVGRGMSGAMTGHVGRIAGIELGGFRFQGVVAMFPDTAFENPRGLDQRNGNLGGGLLSRFNLVLDYGGSRMFLTPNRRFEEPFEGDMSGLVFDTGPEGRVTIAQVLVGSPAEAAGISPGDVLVAVDGQKAEPREMLRGRKRFREDGRELALTLRRDGRERVVKLKLRRLV